MDETRPEFASVWAGADRIAGWLSRDQAAVLFDAAGALPPGSTVVEIGSHQGRSTVVLAAGLSAGSRLVAVDPFDATWRYGGPDTRRLLEDHLAAAEVAGPGRGARHDLARRPHGVRRAGRPRSTSTASTTTGPSATTCAGPSVCRPGRRSWCTTPSPRSG